MSNSYQINLLKYALLISLIGISFAQDRQPLLSELVPHIQTNNYELVPSGNQYVLRITHPEGSQREEVVQQRPPEAELFVQGTIDNLYADNGARVVVVYEAGKNGYVAKVKYVGAGQVGRPTKPPLLTINTTTPYPPLFISASALKSAAG